MNEGWTFRLPDVGEGIPEAELVEWRVAVGDHVSEGDPLAEVMTDKATVELPSPATGTIEWLGAEPGDLVAVGADLVRFALDDAAPATASAVSGPAASGAVEHSRSVPPPPPAAPSGHSDRNGSAPPPVRAADPFAVGDPPPPPLRPLASPAVRRRARELGVDLASVTGTGPSRRVQHADLDRVLLARGASVGGSGSTEVTERDEVERIELRGLRRSIARNMAASWEEIPHFGYVEEVDVTELLRTRDAMEREWFEQAGDEATDGSRAGVLAYVMRAVALAVADHPEMNARFDSAAGVIERHRAVHLGVAVQTPQGLVVTVVDHAEERDVRGCASELARLSQAARDGSATLAELSGSTITITSLGSMGGVVSMPIVNHPEVAIIGVNRIVERPVVRDGAVVVRQVMNVSSSFDHRVVDGWDAARFVQRIRTLLETPALLFTR